MLKRLLEFDKNILKLNSNDGVVLVSNKLGGRIFCAVGDELMHQFRDDLAYNPNPDEFNNIGGNSLWPAPEGGQFAYNYLGDGQWLVQDAINSQPTETVSSNSDILEIGKNMRLSNNLKAEIKMRFQRRITPVDISSLLDEFKVSGISYATDESLIPLEQYTIDRVVVAAWSLEQLPAADGVIAFGRLAGKADGCVNDDFYGNPHPRLSYHGNCFKFMLGGPEKLQIGIKASFQPELLGSYNPEKGTLAIRSTPPRTDGKYINIADNEQKNGLYSTADCFSIFNGGSELNFHELETIAPMECENNILRGSNLHSQTMIFRGTKENLECLLQKYFKIEVI